MELDLPPRGDSGTGRSRRILVVNPGSTSTKLGVHEAGAFSHRETLRHGAEELARFPRPADQLPFRLRCAADWFRARADRVDAVAAMGGLLRPLEGGTYRVNDRMLADAREGARGAHASNLGCLMADEIGRRHDAPAYVVDPVSVDEFEPAARYSGHPLIERSSLAHALSLHAAARRAAAEIGIPHARSSFVVAHLGGGISVAPVRAGRIIDVNDAASDGPFSPERSGGLPLQPFITLCLSGKHSEGELRSMVMGRGGLVAYLGTNDAAEVEERIRGGDALAAEVYGAMGYQIAREIGAAAAVLRGRLDAVVLTGGLAASAMLAGWIGERVSWIARVLRYPGEMEMEALAEGVLRALDGTDPVKEY